MESICIEELTVESSDEAKVPTNSAHCVQWHQLWLTQTSFSLQAVQGSPLSLAQWEVG